MCVCVCVRDYLCIELNDWIYGLGLGFGLDCILTSPSSLPLHPPLPYRYLVFGVLILVLAVELGQHGLGSLGSVDGLPEGGEVHVGGTRGRYTWEVHVHVDALCT